MDSRRIIIVLSVCLGLSLIAVGFLVGRESNRPASVMNVPALAPLPPVGPVIQGTPVAEPPAMPSTPPEPPPATARARRPLAPAHVEPPDSAAPADRGAVEQYFSVTDRLQNADVADPEAAGGSLIAAATSGDTSGLRALTAKAQKAEQTARALTPPPSCAQYHKQLLHILSQNRELLQRLESGISGGDVSALPGLLEQANATKAHADSLAREERAVKKRFGITR